jgi:hypothetical protein
VCQGEDSRSLTAKGGRDFLRKFVEVIVDPNPTYPMAGPSGWPFAGRNDACNDVTGPGDLNLVGLPGLDRGDESGQVGLGVMHVHPHT